MANEAVKYLSDGESLAALVEAMPAHERDEFKSYKSRIMESAFSGRIMVIYTLQRGEPSNIEILKFLDFWMPFQEAPRFRVEYRGREQIVTPVPSRIADREVFISVPQNFVLRWAGQQVASGLQFRAQYAVLLQTRSKEAQRIEGDTQCLTLKRFKEWYPHKADEVRF